jgi:hypothetical protein
LANLVEKLSWNLGADFVCCFLLFAVNLLLGHWSVLTDRGDVPRGTAEIFFRQVKFWKGGQEDAPPVFVSGLLGDLANFDF